MDLEKGADIDPYKIILIGDTGVGKTNVVTRYAKNTFSEMSKPTIGVEFYTKKVTLMDNLKKPREIVLQIWDTAGQERFRGMAGSYYKRALGVVLVFDLTNFKSFSNLEKWLDEVKAYGCLDIEVVLVGNKNDLRDSREVKTEEAILFSKKNNLTYFETSALFNEDNKIEEMFLNLTEKINKKKNMDNNENEIPQKGFKIINRKNEEKGVELIVKKKSKKCC